jgi:hypothetical protein
MRAHDEESIATSPTSVPKLARKSTALVEGIVLPARQLTFVSIGGAMRGGETVSRLEKMFKDIFSWSHIVVFRNGRSTHAIQSSAQAEDARANSQMRAKAVQQERLRRDDNRRDHG